MNHVSDGRSYSASVMSSHTPHAPWNTILPWEVCSISVGCFSTSLVISAIIGQEGMAPNKLTELLYSWRPRMVHRGLENKLLYSSPQDQHQIQLLFIFTKHLLGPMLNAGLIWKTRKLGQGRGMPSHRNRKWQSQDPNLRPHAPRSQHAMLPFGNISQLCASVANIMFDNSDYFEFRNAYQLDQDPQYKLTFISSTFWERERSVCVCIIQYFEIEIDDW